MSENEPLPREALRAGPLRIGEVARRTGVSVDTVRHYERLGLVGRAVRTPAGYRTFEPGVVRRIVEIRAALELGFSLAELANAVRAKEGGQPPCRTVRDLLAAKEAEIEYEISALTARRERIRRTLAGWNRQLRGSAPNAAVGLLFGHGAEPAPPDTRRARRGPPRLSRSRSSTPLRERPR